MKVWTNTAFTGYYPVGVAAVVVADTAEKAAQLLNQELHENGLSGDARAEDMVKVPTNKPFVKILNNGDH